LLFKAKTEDNSASHIKLFALRLLQSTPCPQLDQLSFYPSHATGQRKFEEKMFQFDKSAPESCFFFFGYQQNIPTVVAQTSDYSQRLINRKRCVPMGLQTSTYDQTDVHPDISLHLYEQKLVEMIWKGFEVSTT
jgi:hypothetical protein